MIKKVILLAAAVIAVAVLNYYTDTTPAGKSESSRVLDDVTAKLVLMLKKDGGGAAAVQNQADVKDSPYFKSIDAYKLGMLERSLTDGFKAGSFDYSVGFRISKKTGDYV